MTVEPAWMEEARQLYTSGFGTYEVIGAKLGRSKGSISRACKGLKPPVSHQKLHWHRFRADGRETKRKGVKRIDQVPPPQLPRSKVLRACLPQKRNPNPIPMTPEQKAERARKRQLREQQRKSVERRAHMVLLERVNNPAPYDPSVIVNRNGISLPRITSLDF